FLEEDFAPLHARVCAAVAAGAARAGIDPAADLPGAERTLSPSDAGFHNTLLRQDGELVFLDFEYFGWDDPAKLVADFFLQPQAPLAPPLRPGFLARLEPGFGGRPGFRARLALLYPLLALKWCLIMLNVYLRPALPGREAVENREGQLARASAALGALRAECENRLFPCGGFDI
ncbi:MAG TPA: aminoglycoside phosphotransferase family protein, partial [bacterium]